MTLQEGNGGSRYKVRKLDLPVELERRLEALGLIEGTTVTVLRKKAPRRHDYQGARHPVCRGLGDFHPHHRGAPGKEGKPWRMNYPSGLWAIQLREDHAV